MCGIAGGIAYRIDAEPVAASIVSRLNELQRRRGPDGVGLWSSNCGRVVLGHRRLAIIDTGPGGQQPMQDASGRWIISFNGEIYNYCAVRRELELKGCRFLTKSDTEVVIHAVATWGEDGLNRLRGMYAFALLDTVGHELWLARDPYGIKPLYIAERNGTLWFASQARPLAAAAPVDTRRDAAALVGFYLWGHVPEPFSWWAGIQMFPPGHVQRIGAHEALSRPICFASVEEKYCRRPAEPLQPGELHHLLLDSVRDHMVSDVPVGIFLSAGIDSNVIASLAAECGTKLRTVTLAFDEYAGTRDDEAPMAEAAAKVLDSNHNTVRIGRAEFEELLDDFLESMDQPTIDGLNTYLVSRAASQQGLKVALSGLGGDELFGGYDSFRQIPKLLRMGRHTSSFRPVSGALRTAIRAIPLPGIPPKTAGLLSHSGDIASAYILRRALYLEDELDALIDESWLDEGLQRLASNNALTQSASALAVEGGPVYAQVAVLESCWYMRNQLLRDADWSGMAHGLEVRVPFVDIHLLEHLGPAIASSLPPNKNDLAACAEQLPHPMRSRPKTGFSTPVREWVDAGGGAARGLRGWAANVHRLFRASSSSTEHSGALSVAAE